MGGAVRILWSIIAAGLTLGCADHKVGVYNTPPELSIIHPGAGDAFEYGELVELEALAQDSQDSSEALSVSWSSQLDGYLGGEVKFFLVLLRFINLEINLKK